jgi:salicylate biosynthesis isochorismate synthase/menaquinone-specific isochorismate synthase
VGVASDTSISFNETWLDAAAWARFGRRTAAALRAARSSGGRALVSVSQRVDGRIDPTAVVVASRRTGEHWFCFEQPDRRRTAIAALGAVRVLVGEGSERFERLSGEWLELAGAAHADPPDGPPGSGLIATGGFAFAKEGAHSAAWAGFPHAALTVPEVSLARREDEVWLTVNADVTPDDTEEDVAARCQALLARLRVAPLPLADPAPSGRYTVSSPLAPAHFEEAVARAVQRIRDGEMQKIVLAREVEVHAPVAHDPGAVLGLLREAYSSSFSFAVGQGEATFLGATPELLVRREGQRATTIALAGSTRRSADPAVDDHLGESLLRSDKDRHENAIVARRIALSLRPHSVWVTAAPEPTLARVANIQHLACPIRAQLAAPLSAVELAGLLHPTPAVGAEPVVALALIPALEGLDRGWYAGPVGWTDSSGDGEFCVALRSALLRDRTARCFAGCGIVADSDPAAELAESELKLQVMLPALTG